jgi:hypothetical protein
MGARRPRATTVGGFHGPTEEMGGEDILSWIDQKRRLSKDWAEKLSATSEALVYVAIRCV